MDYLFAMPLILATEHITAGKARLKDSSLKQVLAPKVLSAKPKSPFENRELIDDNSA